jgi:hypothetical protein
MPLQPSSSREFTGSHSIRELSPDLISWTHDWQAFTTRHRRHPAIALDPLYTIPSDLLDPLVTHLPGWITAAEVAFEQDLQQLCQRHHAVGVFHGRPVHDLTLHRPDQPVLSEELLQKLGWDQFWTPAQARQRVKIALERIDPLIERLDAYRGWLFSNPLFLNDLQQLKTRWENAVAKLGSIPSFPVQVPNAPKVRRPRKGRDVTRAFARDFNSFYDRWELQGLATWDLPQPRGANLSGDLLPASVASSSTMISVQVSSILPLPAKYPLRSIVEEAQRTQSPAHLEGWLKVQKQQHAGDLRFTRFRRMFLIHFYRNTVLASRYGDRFAGHVEGIDRAFGQYLGKLGVDSIKKLRVRMQALRGRDS